MQEKESIWRNAFSYGAILGGLLVVWSLVMFMADLLFSDWTSYVSTIIFVGVLFYGVSHYRKVNLDGYVSFGKAWRIGVVMAVYAAVISALYAVVLHFIIAPDLVAEMQKLVLNEMLKDPNMSYEVAGFVRKIMGKALQPALMPVYDFIGSVMSGMFFSLIVALILKKEKNPML